MGLKNFFLLLVFIFLGAITARAQSNCAVTLEHLPAAGELHGFRLGMTMEQVKAHVPPIVFGRTDQFGVSKTSINPAFDAKFDKASFDGVRTISLTFLDGQLIELWLGYDTSFKWQKFDEFVEGISKTLNLPPTWQPKGRGAQINCEGLQVSAAMLAGSPSLRLADTKAEQTLTTRMKAAANAEEEAEADPSATVADKHSKQFYPPGCPGADEISAANRVVFKDIDEAQKAGYKLAKTCHQ